MTPGIAALIPGHVGPKDVLEETSDLSRCRWLFLLRGDLQYDALRAAAKAEHFSQAGARDNAEPWIRPETR